MSQGNFYFSERIVELSVEEARRRAECQQLGRLAKGTQAGNGRWHVRALIGVGQRLEVWGHYLQERYGTGAASMTETTGTLAG